MTMLDAARGEVWTWRGAQRQRTFHARRVRHRDVSDDEWARYHDFTRGY